MIENVHQMFLLFENDEDSMTCFLGKLRPSCDLPVVNEKFDQSRHEKAQF